MDLASDSRTPCWIAPGSALMAAGLPVNVWALSLPVCIHWATKRLRDRLAMARMVRMERGMVTTATRASSHEIHSMMASVPTSMSDWLNIWLRVCWRLWAMLSMSLVTRLRRSPRSVLST